MPATRKPTTTDAKAAAEPGRREKILEAARTVFRAKGYDGATVSDVVHEAGIAQGTFYLYFPSKKEAFFALAQQLPPMMTESVMIAYDPSLSFEERIRAMTRASFECCKCNADLVRLINFGADSISAEVMAQVLEDHPLVKALAAMLRQDIANGNIRPIEPEITARLLMGMYRNALIEAFVLGTEKDAAQLEEAIADLAINALRCPVEPKA